MRPVECVELPASAAVEPKAEQVEEGGEGSLDGPYDHRREAEEGFNTNNNRKNLLGSRGKSILSNSVLKKNVLNIGVETTNDEKSSL